MELLVLRALTSPTLLLWMLRQTHVDADNVFQKSPRRLLQQSSHHSGEYGTELRRNVGVVSSEVHWNLKTSE